MNANKQALNQTGQIGLLILIASMAVAVFFAGSLGFAVIIWGILGFYLLTHQEFSLKRYLSAGRPKK